MNKHYLVTGGTNGIGLSTVKLLLRDKTNVVFSLSRTPSGIEAAKQKTSQLPGTVHFLVGDVSVEENVKQCIEQISAQTTALDGLVNCAGVIHPGGVESLAISNWRTTIDINLTSAFMIVKYCLPLLKKASAPAIVNVSSISSILLGASVGYSVCKAGLDMLTKGLARELAKYRVRVNAVNPGITKTGFQVRNKLMGADKYENFLNDISATYPLGIGQPEDVANAIVFLLSEESRWITGSLLIVDGGRIINS